MKPPECHLCGVRIKNFENAGLIYFKKTSNDLEWDKRVKEEGIVGHPPYAEWFCENHYSIAKKYASYPCSEAMRKIKAELQK